MARSSAISSGSPVSRAQGFALTIFGLDRVQATLVASWCNLYRSQGRHYYVVSSADYAKADIVLVGVNDPAGIMQWRRADETAPGKPVIFVGEQFNHPLQPGQYRLKRIRLSRELLNVLDSITIQEFQFVPELVIGDDSCEIAADSRIRSHLNQLAGDGVAHVLVVDDSLAVRTQMELGLRLHRVTVDTAESAEIALALVNRRRYDLIFLDVVLPEMDGYKACRLLKSDPSVRKTPIVMLTGKSSSFNKVRGVMAGCDRYLTKPVDAQELHAVLREFIPAMH